MQYEETRKRSIAKAVLYRIIGILGTAVIVLIFTGEYKLAGAIAIADFCAGVAFYYCFERIWNIIPWGKK